MALRQITNDKVTSLEALDKQLLSRQAGVRTVSVENITPGLQQGETIDIQQRPNYKTNEETAG